MHVGVLFTPTPEPGADATAAVGRVPTAVGAYLAAQQPTEALKWAGMGAAALRPDGSALSDYTLAAGSSSPNPSAPSTNMALSQLVAKPLSGGRTEAGGTAAAASSDGMVYAVEWRAVCVGLGPGSLSMRLPADAPAVELAVVKRNARRQRLLPPVSRRVVAPAGSRRSASRAARQRSTAAFTDAGSGGGSGLKAANQALQVGGGVLALLQGVMDTNPAAGQRLQLNLRGCLGGDVGTAPGRSAGAFTNASAAALLKVCICSVRSGRSRSSLIGSHVWCTHAHAPHETRWHRPGWRLQSLLCSVVH